MNKKIEEFVNEAKGIVGNDFVDFVDKTATDGQLAILTKEEDKGEESPAKYYEALRGAVRKHFGRAALMPFPIGGKLAYVVAGLRIDLNR